MRRKLLSLSLRSLASGRRRRDRQSRLLGGGHGRRRRPRPDLLRGRQAENRLRRRAQRGGRRPCARRTARSSRWDGPDDGDFLVARYNLDGSLDPSFSGDGKRADQLHGRRRRHRRGASGQGKIVVVGFSVDSDATGGDFALARYNPNGSLDPSFSGDGKQTTDFGVQSTEANGVALQANGKIVAVGARPRPATTSRSPATTRTARSTRASPATASRRPTSGHLDAASGVAIQADGKIVAVGWRAATASTSRSPATTPTGRSTRASPATASRRPTSGLAPTARGRWRSRATARSSRSASRRATGIGDFALARYNPNGSLDTSFSGDGKQTTDFSSGPTTGRTTWRSRRTAGSSRSASRRRRHRQRLRARPLQPQRLARHELLRRRQEADQLRRRRQRERGGAPGRRQDRRGRRRQRRSSRWPAIWGADQGAG